MSVHLPTWLTNWLGTSSASHADGATWQLESAWTWPPWATVILIFVAIAFITTLYAQEASGAGRWYRGLLIALRLTALAIALIMLAQWALSMQITGPPPVALVLDRSASMGITDRYADAELPGGYRERLLANEMNEPTRLNFAKLLLADEEARLLRELAARYRLEAYWAAAGLERVAASSDPAELLRVLRELTPHGPDSQATRLGEAVQQVLDNLRGATPAAVVLLSDGVTTEGLPLSAAAQEARRRGVPLFAVGIGSGRPPRDIELADVLVDDAVFVDDPVNLEVQLRATGLEGESARLILRLEGDADALAEEDIRLPAAGKTLSVPLLHRPTQPGPLTYVVEIAPRSDEVNRQNNRQERVVEVRDAKVRVLLVSGYPNYEFRFLKTLLERDSTLQLATYLQDADPEYAEQDKTALRNFPLSRDELFEYDVLVIVDADPRLLARGVWPNVRAFTAEKGGGLALVAGSRYLPWLYMDNSDVNALLPIDLGQMPADSGTLPAEVTRGFAVRPTPLGLHHPALQLGDTRAQTERIWDSLPPLYWLYQVGDLKPAAQVLAQSAIPGGGSSPQSAIPLVCFQYVGAGRVLFHAVDSTWRWRIGAGDVYFARYWLQSIRFLARSRLTSGRGAQLTADRREYRRGEPITLRVRFLDTRLAPPGDEASVAIESAGQPRRRVTLQRNPAVDSVFESSLHDLAVGTYAVLLTEPQLPGTPPATRFSVVAPPGEFARLEMDAAALSEAAETTGGKFYTLANADRLLADLPAGRRVPIEKLPPVSLWNRWWMIAAFLVAITSEWILRKRKGML